MTNNNYKLHFTPIALVIASSFAVASPDLILTNGDIITVSEEQHRVEAIAIKDGKIHAIGSNADVLKYQTDTTQIRDLHGKTVTPGFIDAHGHFAQYIPLIESEFLYPTPMGSVNSIDDIKQTMQRYFAQPELDDSIMHVAFGYDDAELAEKRHPTKQELDAFTQGYNFCAVHISGHLASCNSNGLAFIGFNDDTPNPNGGVIRRDANGEMTGVLEESAIYPILGHLPAITEEDAIRKFSKVQDMFASYGVTTAQEGLATLSTIKIMKNMAENELLKIDMLAYAKWVDLAAAIEILPMKATINGFTLAGVKLVGDGSPQGKTAYLSSPYYEPPHSHAYDYHGYPVLTQKEMNQWVDIAYQTNAQILSHSNGDASADILLNAIEKADSKYGKEDRRTVVIHAQTTRLDQVKRMKQNDMIPSFFPAHTYFWGDYHRDSVLGPWRASNISPMGWANSVELPFTIHMDAPVLFPDMMTNMWSAVNRVTRSGDTLGEHHRISAYQALESITKIAAYQNFEEQEKGTIEVGKRADLVILDRNPLEVVPREIKDVRVLETIKDGKTIYQNESI
ncbi:amidohydrolase [Vibrio scophthalmi]|uniref:Exoenzyme regulatory protein AepA n=1 Tax=Vibrio scophthalmi LMG 19158 TaxID=870967 RepID=F9RNE4_9VIBR|nr:exoenzyme regulatory protein AepA precursor [Vibrio scophthalmi LMG 19158]